MGRNPTLHHSKLLTMRIIERYRRDARVERGGAPRRQAHRLRADDGFLASLAISALVRDAKARGDRLVVSIFVNPTQFGPGEDFSGYPRDFERDCELLEAEGVDALFHPSVDEMYPQGGQTRVEVERLSLPLCGASRPGHFRGVATVVTKLFNIVLPHLAVFGEKDYQQLQVIRRLVRDLSMGSRNHRPSDRPRSRWFGHELAQLLSERDRAGGGGLPVPSALQGRAIIQARRALRRACWCETL